MEKNYEELLKWREDFRLKRGQYPKLRYVSGKPYLIKAIHPDFGEICGFGFGDTWKKARLFSIVENMKITELYETRDSYKNISDKLSEIYSSLKDKHIFLKIEDEPTFIRIGDKLEQIDNECLNWFTSDSFYSIQLMMKDKFGEIVSVFKSYNDYWEYNTLEIGKISWTKV